MSKYTMFDGVFMEVREHGLKPQAVNPWTVVPKMYKEMNEEYSTLKADPLVFVDDKYRLNVIGYLDVRSLVMIEYTPKGPQAHVLENNIMDEGIKSIIPVVVQMNSVDAFGKDGVTMSMMLSLLTKK